MLVDMKGLKLAVLTDVHMVDWKVVGKAFQKVDKWVCEMAEKKGDVLVEKWVV